MELFDIFEASELGYFEHTTLFRRPALTNVRKRQHDIHARDGERKLLQNRLKWIGLRSQAVSGEESKKRKSPVRFTLRGSRVGDNLLSLREVSSAAKA